MTSCQERHEWEPEGPVTGTGNAGTAMSRQQMENQKIFPYPRVKGGYYGHGVGSLVNCRYLLLVSWRL